MRSQMAMDVIRTVVNGSGLNGGIQGDVAVVRYVRKVDFIVTWADATVVHLRGAGAAGTVLHATFTGFGAGAEGDIPRTVKIIRANAADNGKVVTINGYDQYGDLVAESITISGATTRGNVAFTWIVSADFPIQVGNITIQLDSKIGVCGGITLSDLKAVSKLNVGVPGYYDLATAPISVDSTYDTFEVTGVPLVAADFISVTARM